jgi:hypothetical protein
MSSTWLMPCAFFGFNEIYGSLLRLIINKSNVNIMAKRKHPIDKTELYDEMVLCKNRYYEICERVDKESELEQINKEIISGKFKNLKQGLRHYMQLRKNEALSDKLLRMLMKLAEHALRKLHHEREADKQDCLSNAYKDILYNWTSFKEKEGVEVFSYFTSVSYTGNAKGWREIYPEKYEGTLSLSANSVNGEQGMFNL